MKNHTSRFLTLVEESKQRITEISVHELQEKIHQQKPFYIIDVREANEWATGHIPSAIHFSKGVIERDIERVIPDTHVEIVVYCSGGFRCALVADNLQRMGYHRVYSLAEGLQGWVNAGYPIEG